MTCDDPYAANGPPEWGGLNPSPGGPCYGDGKWNRAGNMYTFRGSQSHVEYYADDAALS